MTAFLNTAAAALALLAAALIPAAAQQGAPQVNLPTVPAASVALAKEILTLKQANAIYQGAVVGLVTQTRDAFLKDHLDKQKDLNEAAAKVAQDLAGRDAEIGEAMARLFASGFTEQELRDLANFYKSPLGRKVIENEPRAAEQSMMFLEGWAQKFSDEIVARLREEMKKRGKEI